MKLSLVLTLAAVASAAPPSSISRRKIVQSYNVHRTAASLAESNASTPLQVGNGNFAFGADITGLQTFRPFNTLSTWGWYNFSLPAGSTPDSFVSTNVSSHGRQVPYDFPNTAHPNISDWLIQNPHRLNLARIGLDFGRNVSESDLVNATQTLDLWTGGLKSNFVYNNTAVEVETWSHPEQDMLGIAIRSDLLASGDLGLFIDFPFPEQNKKFEEFIGAQDVSSSTFNSENITTYFDPWYGTIQRTLYSDDGIPDHSATANGSSYYLQLQWNNYGHVTGPTPGTHGRYVLTAANSTELLFVAAFSSEGDFVPMTYGGVTDESADWWANYWTTGGFVDLVGENNSTEAKELQRRTILSQYLTVVNSASSNPPQESGLVNNGWYGKFHLEMVFWHLAHFARWGHADLLARSLPGTYARFLASSIARAARQGYAGARWGKMTDPTGRSAPGQINVLLVWQQPHPLYFAELQYRTQPNAATLKEWDAIVTATADFMASFVFWNASSGHYDLGPPLYVAAETGDPFASRNPAFELAYWRFGLDVAIQWKERQNASVPAKWKDVRAKLAPLPVVNGTYATYEGIPNMWTDPETVTDHPAVAGIYGWLPPTDGVDVDIMKNTTSTIHDVWDLDNSFGWDFPMLAMNALRLGNVSQAVAYLLDARFQFDDAGYPLGGARVATPYMPSSGGLLLAVAMLAGGWDGEATPAPHFPAAWHAKAEGFTKQI